MTAGIHGTAIEWSADHIADLTRLWSEGHSASVIGKQLGRTRNSVIGKVHRLDLATRLSTISARKERPPRGPRANNGAFRKSRAKPLHIVRVKPPRPQEVPPPHARMISLMELTALDCKWPIGHPKEPGFGFCGAWRFGNGVYCDHHTRMAYIPVMLRKAGREAYKRAEAAAA